MIPKTAKAWLALVALLGSVGVAIVVNVGDYEEKWSRTVRDRGAKTDSINAEMMAELRLQRQIANERHAGYRRSIDEQHEEQRALRREVEVLTSLSGEGVEDVAKMMAARLDVLGREMTEVRTCQVETIAAWADSLAAIRAQYTRLLATARIDTVRIKEPAAPADTTKWWNPFD